MPNQLLTIDMITRESLRIAHEKLTFIGTIDRQYDDSFARTGAKIGQTLRVREPNEYTRRQGSRIMAVQEQKETYGTITVAQQDGVDMSFNSAELALSIDEFSQRYIEPAMSTLVSGIEADFLKFATQHTPNAVGTPGTAITDLSVPGLARAKLNQALAPKDDKRCIQADSITMADIVNGLKGLFQDSSQIAEQYREGMMGRTAMATWYENERVYTHTNIADVVGTTDAAALVTDGGNLIDMHTTVVSPAVGSVFTIAGVYDIHPETKAPYPNLKQFTVIATSAAAPVTVYPTIWLTGAKRNVGSATGTALAATDFDAKALTFIGAASIGYSQSLMYHKEAFQFVSADLPLMDDSVKCVRRVQDNLSLRVWQASDIRNDELLMRIDILYGMAALRSQWACRMYGRASA